MSEHSPLDFLPFIAKFENLLIELSVHKDLWVTLMTPYLSERCRTLVNRLQGDDATSYDYVKKYLMEQLRLVPSYFIDEFNRLVRPQSETYKSYICRVCTVC